MEIIEYERQGWYGDRYAPNSQTESIELRFRLGHQIDESIPRNILRMSDTSAVFRLLAAKPRRRLLLLLCETEAVSVPGGLRERGAVQSSHAHDSQPTQDPSAESTSGERFDLKLIHVHLPKLEEAGLIEWDPEHEAVRRGPEFREIRPILQLLNDNPDAFPSGLV